MSYYIVLVKQVPDVSQITDNAFHPRTGNLIRKRLPSIINDLDAQALAFAHRMKELSADTTGKLICLSMGPPMASEVLHYGLSRDADDAVLLTDRALGGGDTWATANPLAYAIRKIAAEKLNGTEDYYIIAGMQSVDGDTAQVPAQIACELRVPCVSYATDVGYTDGKFYFKRIVSDGTQLVEPVCKPTVITVAKYEYPRFASFAATRRSNRFTLTQWGTADVKPTATGLAGSKTRVIRVFPPGKTNRKCHRVHSVSELAERIIENLSDSRGAANKRAGRQPSYVLPSTRPSLFDRPYEATEKEIDDYAALGKRLREMNVTRVDQITDEIKERILASDREGFNESILDEMLEGYRCTEPAYSGDVWVMAEEQDGELTTATFELTGKARELADSLNVKVGVVLIGGEVKAQANELVAAGADLAYVIEHPLLKQFDPFVHCKAFSGLFEEHQPQIALFGATPQGRILAPLIAYQNACGLTADCTDLAIRDSSRKGQIALLIQTRPAVGGNLMATICSKDSRCQMATARPGVMKRLPSDSTRKGKVIICPVEITPEDLTLKVLKTERTSGLAEFDSDVIISGGKGMKNRDSYDRLLNALCDVVRGRFDLKVEKGATRTAVEQGFAKRIHQVGQTGTAVGPSLYIAIGISGAIQHMIGVANTETIVAINSDPSAPIFRQCDYYIVGNAETIVPELVTAIQG